MLIGTCHCGAVRWTFDGMPESVTACNCTLCRRYGVLWAYDFVGGKIALTGETAIYKSVKTKAPSLEVHFCPACACIAAWRATSPEDDGRVRIAVNLRLSEPGPIAHLAIDHFDGLDTFGDLPGDGRCVRDMWF